VQFGIPIALVVMNSILSRIGFIIHKLAAIVKLDIMRNPVHDAYG
jgi:hypothetical protein